MSSRPILKKLFKHLSRKSPRPRKRFCLYLESLEPRQLLAADFNLVSDINPVDNVAREIGSSIVMNEVLYFRAATVNGGIGLWRSDGTDTGTMRIGSVKEPKDFAVVGSTLYFTAKDDLNGRELWRTDGTANGTKMVKDISPGPADSNPESLVNVSGTLFFSANDGVHGRELWRSNGVGSGTVMVRDLNTATTGLKSGIPEGSELLAVGNTVYFAGNMALTGTELFKSNGTSQGTSLVRDVFKPDDILSSQSSHPMQLTRVGSKVYFVASSMEGILAAGPTLWVTDGTASGTKRIFDSSGQSPISAVTALGTSIYFAANGNLYRTDGSNGVIAPILVKANIGTVAKTQVIGDQMYFSTENVDNSGSLRITDGTPIGTVELKRFDGQFNVDNNVPSNFHNWNGVLYFKVFVDVLWKSSGSVATSLKVVDVPGDFVEILGSNSTRIYLDDGKLLTNDGTIGATVPVQIPTTFGSAPSNLLANGDTLYFTANDGKSGIELWRRRADFNPAMIRDIAPGPAGSEPRDPTVFQEMVYFSADAGNDRRLWRTDGTEDGTILVQPSQLRNVSDPESLTVVGDMLYFTAVTSTVGRELWRIDKAGQASLVKDIRVGAIGSNPDSLVSIGKQLYFSADNGINGRELWTTNGTSAGTQMVADLRPGSDGSQPNDLTPVGGRLFFSARNATSGYELFSSNGTAAQTTLVKDIHPTSNSFPNSLTNVGGVLYFTANDPVAGRELWKSDGTSAGTMRIKDIAPGLTSSLPSELTNVNGILFFQATSGTGDVELWRSNGTSTTTALVRNINTTGSSTPSQLTNIAGFLYFTATNAAQGHELWRSTGSSTGTTMIFEFQPGSSSSLPAGITRVQNRVYVSALLNSLGRELFVDDLFDQTVGDDTYLAQYVTSSSGNLVRIQKSATRGAPTLLAILPASEQISFDSSGGSDSITFNGTSGNDTFQADRLDEGFNVSVDLKLNGASFKLEDFANVTLAGLSGDDLYRFRDAGTGSDDMVLRIGESGSGRDVLDFSELTSAATINLGLTAMQDVSARLKLQMLSATHIEDIIGSPFDDVLTGNASPNFIQGGLGNDTLNGQGGSDTVSGGLGNDVYRFDDAFGVETDAIIELPNEGVDKVAFHLVTAPVAFGLGFTGPQLVHANRTLMLNAVDTFENVDGGQGDDLLKGNSLSNELNGKSGSDSMSGGLGNDVYIFDNALSFESDTVTENLSGGRDMLSFAKVTSDVTLNLGISTSQDVHINRSLTLSSASEFEGAAGGSGNDILNGNSRNNILVGNAGNDHLFGIGGRDILIGGLNFDTLSGDTGEDILIAGVTDFDNVYSDLEWLMAEWSSTDPIGTRITKLRTGVGPNSIALTAGTSVNDDNGELDELSGNAALDWFFRDLTDLVTDLNGEVIDEL
jgi:ELWxxDGT repeat protein